MVAPLGKKHIEPCKNSAKDVFRLMFLTCSDELCESFWMIHLPRDISKDPEELRRSDSLSLRTDARLIPVRITLCQLFGFSFFAKSIFLISRITVNWTLHFSVTDFSKSVDPDWDELRPVSPDLQIYRQKRVQTLQITA